MIDKDALDLSSQFYARIISGIEAELIRHKLYFQFNSVDKESFGAYERLSGFQRARQLYGLDGDPAFIVENCKSRIDEGFRAMGTLKAVLSIPRENSMVGFDGIHLAAEVNPPLNTVHVPTRLVVRESTAGPRR